MMIKMLIPQVVKRMLVDLRQWLKRNYVRISDGYSLSDLEASIRKTGIQSGDTVMVHVGMRHFKGIQGSPQDVIDLLKKLLGDSGTLLMPSMPFRSAAADYIESGAVTDLRTTPSAMGLVTEIFRNNPGTLRSVHPTHPILASGPKAEEMLAGHHDSKTPCGVSSPFDNLNKLDGKVLLLGAGIGCNTFYHYLEEIFEKQFPDGVIEQEPRDMLVIDMDGVTHKMRNRLYDKEFSRKRDLSPFAAQLKADGVWCEQRVGQLEIIGLNARDCYASMQNLVSSGKHCYNRDIN